LQKLKNSKISNFALGGDLLGEPNSGEPKLPSTKTPSTTLISKEELKNLNIQPPVNNEKSSTSRLKGTIVELQNGSNKDGIPGQWVYYKKRSTPGFNPETDRDFVYDKNSTSLTDTYEYHTFMNERRKAVEKNRAMLNTNVQLTEPLASNNANTFSMGGNMYAGGGPFDKSTASYDPTKISLGLPQQQSNQFLDNLNYVKNINSQDLTALSPEQLQENNGYSNPVVNARTFGPQGGHSTQSQIKNITDKVGTSLNKTGQFIKDNRGVLRYAPVAMNAYQLHKLNKEGYDTVNPIINNTRYNPQYMDEKALTNQINAETNYTANALANASNGSLGSLSNNILGMQLNKTKALSDAYSKVADVNRNEDKTAQQFNLGIDEANIGRRIGAEDRTAMNKGAFKTEQSKLRGQIGTDLGEIGKEETYKEMAKKLYNYDFNGKYYIAPDGTKMTTQEMANKIDEDRNIQQQKKAQIGTTVLKGFNNKTK
jgi:hypothetical protein